MKRKITFFVAALLLATTNSICHAQTATAPPTIHFTIFANDANSRTWERTTSDMAPSGQTISRKHRVTEIATGLNYWTGTVWALSDPSFQVSVDGQSVYADKLQTKVRLSANLATKNSVTIQTPDGIVLNSTPVAIGLYDEASGNSIIIASITNCYGALIGSNQVLYENAFNGISADIIYTVKRDSFSQDIVWKQNIDPSEYGFPTNSSRIQIITALDSAAQPEEIAKSIYVEKNASIRSHMASPDFIDHTLKFGQLTFGRGRAFSSTRNKSVKSAAVGKQYQKIDGQTYLIESVEYHSVKSELDSLPRVSSSSRMRKPKGFHKNYAAIPVPRSTAKATISIKKHAIAAAAEPKGMVIDYVALTGTEPEPFTLRGDTTYFVSGAVDCDDLIVQGGTVVKYPNDTTAYIEVDGNLTSDTSSFRPACFTAADDDSIGESMNGIWTNYSGTIQSGGYANPALLLDGSDSPQLYDFRFLYAQEAVCAPSGIALSDCQIVNCVTAVQITGGDGSLALKNCLAANLSNLILDSDTGGGYNTLNCLSCTIDNCGSVMVYQDSDQIYSVNSIFSNIGSVATPYSNGNFDGAFGSNNGFYNNDDNVNFNFGDNQIVDLNGSSPYGTSGGGNYYLADNIFWGQGTTNIDPGLLTDLQTKTTQPPTVYSSTSISVATMFSPGVPRDTSSNPDLGYHYDPIDVAFSGVNVASNLTFAAGTVVGWFGGNGYGIALTNSATVNFNGLVTSPCYVVCCDAVQEAGSGQGAVGGIVAHGSVSNSTSIASSVSAQFTRFVALANDPGNVRDDTSDMIFQPRHSEFWSGTEGGGAVQLLSTNCLFDTCDLAIQDASSTDSALSAENCTMHANSLETTHTGGSTWPVSIQNCSFDGTTFSIDTTPTYWNYNAYLSGTSEYSGSHDVSLSSGFNWQNSWFGSYYLPPGSPLITNGSTYASSLGLYHFTTQTNQIPDGTNIVTIGYHYVAADQFGNPQDGNGDGIPDYLQDPAGNGSGNWDTTMLLNVIITQPKNGSTIP